MLFDWTGGVPRVMERHPRIQAPRSRSIRPFLTGYVLPRVLAATFLIVVLIPIMVFLFVERLIATMPEAVRATHYF